MISYEEIPTQAWTRIERAAEDPRDPMRLAVFATVDNQGRPTVRTLVLRGAQRTPPRLWFHCDAASSKIAHVRERPEVEALFYDPGAQLQLRVRGGASAHVDDEVAKQHWAQSRIAAANLASSLFLGAHGAQPDPRLRSASAQSDEPARPAQQAHFAVIELTVDEIDWLQIDEERQRRALLRASSGWKPESIEP